MVVEKTEAVVEQDQTVESEVVKEVKAGEEQEAVETAATETEGGLLESKDGSLSAEDIMSTGEEVAPEHVGEEKGLSPESQKKINNKINAAVKEKKIAQNRADIAERKLAEKETVSSAPTERPLIPLREDSETGADYQAKMSKYEDDLGAYNNSQVIIKDQNTRINEEGKADRQRFVDRAERMRIKYPDNEEGTGFGQLVTTDNPDGSNPFGNVAEIVLRSEYSTEVAYLLRRNPAELERIQGLDRNSALLAIGELTGRFKTVQNKQTKAPKALSTIRGDTETSPTTSIYKIKNADEFLRVRNKEILRERNGPK